ncbi:hypothetical protein BDV06DRAFT_216710 [Aspergillus oleicola]
MSSLHSNLSPWRAHVEDISKVHHAGPATTTERRPGYTTSLPEDERLDKRINLKMGLILQGIDKGNIGNAPTSQTFLTDTNVRETDVSDSVSLFSATYVPFMPVSVAIGRILGLGRIFAAFYYVGTPYPAYMAGLRMGFVSMSFTLSGAFSALIAYGILQVRSSLWADWQLLFIIEGAIIMVAGLLCIFFLTHKLSTTWFFTVEEHAHTTHRMALDTACIDPGNGLNTEEHDHSITWYNIKTALEDWRKMLIIVWTGCATVPVYGFTIFSPLIVKEMGFDGVCTNLMCVPPFMLGAVALLVFVWVSDPFRERSITAAVAMTFSIIGYIVAIACGTLRNNLRYGFLFVIMIGAGSVNPLTAAWLIDNTPDKVTRSTVMGLFGWKNVAGVIAGQVYLSKYGPGYRASICITLGIVAFGLLGFLGTRAAYMFENRRRKKLIANWKEEDFDREGADLDKSGEQSNVYTPHYPAQSGIDGIYTSSTQRPAKT